MIEVEDLTRYYGTTRALHDVSFSIDERAIVGFLGLNGAGKSTLLKILSGLLLPSAGRVTIDGVDAVEAPDSLRSRIGFLPEDPPLYDDMHVDDFLTWCGQVKGSSREEVERRLPEVTEVCDIDDMRNRLVGELSHGYRKRVGIAQAIIHDPELVILDEPISGLDPVQIVGMRDVLRRLREECTVLVSSHILSEISETCDRVLVLHDGELVADGSVEELAERIGGATRLTFELAGDREAAEAVFDDHASLRNWSLEESSDGLATYEVQLDEDDRETLVAELVEAGVGLRGLDETETELEQAFLGVTGEDGEQVNLLGDSEGAEQGEQSAESSASDASETPGESDDPVDSASSETSETSETSTESDESEETTSSDVSESSEASESESDESAEEKSS